MRMRITTNMAMNTYRYNLQNSTYNLTDSRNKVLSHRKFDSFEEDPSSAIQAWRVRRAMVNTNCYAKNNQDTLSRFKIAHDTLGVVEHELTDLDGRKSAIYAASDPTASGRNELGKVLSETAESVIHSMNGAKSGSDFVFAGDDELNAPFSWNADRTILYYRGVNVSAGGVESPLESIPSWVPCKTETDGTQTPLDFDDAGVDPDKIPDRGGSAMEQAWIDYYKQAPGDRKPKPSDNPFAGDALDDFGVSQRARDIVNGKTVGAVSEVERAWAQYTVDQGDLTHLKMMAEEEAPIDLGMGLLRDENGELVPGTYYNRTLPGIEMLGYGVDEDGDPKNVCMIMKKFGEIYSRCDDDGYYASEQDRADAMRLLNKLKAGQSYVSGKYVDVHAESSFLTQNQERLDQEVYDLDEQRINIEQVDLADAITAFSWDYYCYSAALKVGTQLLSQSLIDYMS